MSDILRNYVIKTNTGAYVEPIDNNYRLCFVSEVEAFTFTENEANNLLLKFPKLTHLYYSTIIQVIQQ